MWYKLAASIRISLDMAKYNNYLTILQASPDPRVKFRQLMSSLGEMHPDREALQEAFKATKDQPGSNANQTPKPNPSPKPNPAPAANPTPNTTDKDLIPLNQLEKRDPNDGPSDLIVRPQGGDIIPRPDDDKPVDKPDVDKPEKDKDDNTKKTCIIEEEVFIQNLLTGLTGYALTYFKTKIFTISQDTYRGNRSPLAPLQRALGLTPPGALGPNTNPYDPASSSIFAPVSRDFARPAGPIRDKDGRILTDSSGAPLTVTAPVKDKTVVWNTSDVQSIMSFLEKIAQMPELQKYGAKELTNILRHPLDQVKNDFEKLIDRQNEINDQIDENNNDIDDINNLLVDAKRSKTPKEEMELNSKKRRLQNTNLKLQAEITKLQNIKPETEVVPFKEFYKLTELSRYYKYKGVQINEKFCTLEAQLIEVLNNVLNPLGKMEKDKRIRDSYENARRKKMRD
jgi:hypothetical protein